MLKFGKTKVAKEKCYDTKKFEINVDNITIISKLVETKNKYLIG